MPLRMVKILLKTTYPIDTPEPLIGERNNHHRYPCWSKWAGLRGSGKIIQMKQSIKKLRKFFRLEADRGYDNKAVMGGLANILSAWELEAREDQIPEQIIQAVITRLRDYHRLSEESREDALKGIWQRVNKESLGDGEESPDLGPGKCSSEHQHLLPRQNQTLLPLLRPETRTDSCS